MAAQMGKLAGSVALTFDAQLQEGQYKLLEVSEAMLAEIMAAEFDPHTHTAKHMVEFRGASTDEAALCTDTKTYSVRLVESSNTQLLVCANPKNIFLPLESDELYADSAVAPDANPSPLKKQKLAAAAAAATAAGTDPADDIYVPQRLIRGMVQHHYEVTEILPRVHVLRELLGRRLYEGEEEDDEEDAAAGHTGADADAAAGDEHGAGPGTPQKQRATGPKRYDTAALRQLVQASDAQLRAGLAQLEAFEDSRGHWRMLHPDLTGKVFASLLDYCEERSWARTSDIPADQCAEGLRELYEPLVTRHVLKIFSKPHVEGDDPNLFTLDANRVCLLRALQLFAKKEPYPHTEFMSEWQASVPAGMEVSATMLRGHALCETSTALEALARSASGSLQLHGSRASDQSTLVWRYFPLSSLSPLVKTRFQQLFDVRPKWKLADIECYALDLCAPGQTLEQLLLKHARPVSTDNIVNGKREIVYTKR